MGYAILCMPHATPDTLVRVFEYYFFIYIYILACTHSRNIITSSSMDIIYEQYERSMDIIYVCMYPGMQTFHTTLQQLVQQDYTYQLVHVYSRVHSMQIMHTSQQQQQYSSTTNSMHTTLVQSMHSQYNESVVINYYTCVNGYYAYERIMQITQLVVVAYGYYQSTTYIQMHEAEHGLHHHHLSSSFYSWFPTTLCASRACAAGNGQPSLPVFKFLKNNTAYSSNMLCVCICI